MEPELSRNHSPLSSMRFQTETILTSSTAAFISSGSTLSAKFFLGSDLDFFIIPCLYSFLCLYNYACYYRKTQMNFSVNTSVLLITHTYWNLPPSLILPLSNSLTLLSLWLYSLTRISHKYFKFPELNSFCSFCKLILSRVFLTVTDTNTLLQSFSLNLL